MMANRAVFLDRDGVINENLDDDYVKTWDEFVFLPGAIEAIKRLAQSDLYVIIVSNQAGINKGIFSIDALDDIHKHMLDEIETRGGKIKAIYYCQHRDDENCECRKPKPGMLYEASKEHNIDLHESYLIGDSIRDIEAGSKAGCITFLVMTGKGTQELKDRERWKHCPDYIVPDLSSAVDIILDCAINSLETKG